MEEERGKARKTEIHTHILLNLQDPDEEQFLGLVLVEELWIKKHHYRPGLTGFVLSLNIKITKSTKNSSLYPMLHMLSHQTKMS